MKALGILDKMPTALADPIQYFLELGGEKIRLGEIAGAGIGAAIGHNVHGRDGAVVGGAIGAIAGASEDATA